MAIRGIPFVLCLVASLLIVNLSANAAFPGPGEIPDPPGLEDNPNIPDFGDHPSPPGPGDNPPDDQILGIENALEHITEDTGNAYDVLNYLSGLEELPPSYPPGLGHSPPGPSDFAPTGFESQPMGSDLITYSASPEPATLGLLILGSLALLRRRP